MFRVDYLLWWNLKCLTPHIYFLINIHTGNYKEDPRTTCSSCKKSAKSEYDSSLVLLQVLRYFKFRAKSTYLDNFHYKQQGERKSNYDEKEGEYCQGQSTHTRTFLTLYMIFTRIIFSRSHHCIVRKVVKVLGKRSQRALYVDISRLLSRSASA